MVAFEPLRVNRGNGVSSPSSYLNLNQDTVPGHVRYIRVYERLDVGPGIMLMPDDERVIDIATWDVIRDALLCGRYDAAQELVTGTIGQWRPSTIEINRFMSMGSQRIYVQHTIARALWNVPLDIPTYANEGFQFEVINDCDRERLIMCHLVIEDDSPFEPAERYKYR